MQVHSLCQMSLSCQLRYVHCSVSFLFTHTRVNVKKMEGNPHSIGCLEDLPTHVRGVELYHFLWTVPLCISMYTETRNVVNSTSIKFSVISIHWSNSNCSPVMVSYSVEFKTDLIFTFPQQIFIKTASYQVQMFIIHWKMPSCQSSYGSE